MTIQLDYALAFADSGCCVIPTARDGSKRPAFDWKAYQTHHPTLEQLDTWFTGAYQGLGLVTGNVSGGLEMLELEGRAADLGDHLAQALHDHGAADLWARLCGGYLERTPSGGYHWLYRVDAATGTARKNTKLARRPATPDELADNPQDKVKVLIETRGEGGYVVTAPSSGTTHPTGRPWVLVAGGPATIPTITAAERDLLHAVCTTFDQMGADTNPAGESTRPRSTVTTSSNPGDLRPGDDFNNRAVWEDILDGWTRGPGTRNGGHMWTRAGKHPRDGYSATTGTADDGIDRLYVFSSSTDFEIETPYSKFGAVTHLDHGGDFEAAATALRANGFGGDLSAPRALSFSGPPTGDQAPVLSLVHSTSHPAAPADGTTALKVAQAGSQVPKHVDVTLSDDGNAQLLVARHGTRFRYVPERGRWLRWDGHRWRPCADASPIVEAARETIRAIEPREALDRKHKLRSLSRRAIEAMVALARSDDGINVSADLLDADPYALCTPAGVIDLRTGVLTPADPTQLNTKVTGATPVAGIAARWLRFLHDTFAGDQAVIDFVQRLAGYSATGLTTHHVLPFLHGAGGNGKSVFLDVMLKVLGDYATTAPSGFLMSGREQHETELARLDRMRLVVCSEVNQHDRFDEAKVKILTGGDQVTARFMRQDYFTFEPTHKLWLMGNHQPRVGAGGESFWRRLRLLPFTRIVPKEQRIEGLADQLVDTEGPQILAWLLDGARQALEHGLAEPRSVLAATEAYAVEEDALARFVADRCHLGPAELRVNTADMRSAYETWCRREGERPISPQVFGRELRSRWQVGDAKSNGTRLYTGVVLVSDEPGEQNELSWWQK